MAVCEDCDRDMMTAGSCSMDLLLLPDGVYDRARLGPRGPARCGDCGVGERGVHHLGCDLERCPRCHRQLISCGCGLVEVEEEDDALVPELEWAGAVASSGTPLPR